MTDAAAGGPNFVPGCFGIVGVKARQNIPLEMFENRGLSAARGVELRVGSSDYNEVVCVEVGREQAKHVWSDKNTFL